MTGLRRYIGKLMSCFRRKKCRFRLCCACLVAINVYLMLSIWTGTIARDDFDQRIHRNRKHTKGAYNQMNNNEDVYLIEKCEEKRNFVFIKNMKCATETIGTIVRRFGYFRNLSFVIPVKKNIYLGWPFLMKESDFRPSSRGYNILMEHSIYSRSIMGNVMPKDTVYITMIREPFNHVKSTIHYFKILQISNVQSSNPLSEYFHNLEKYEAVYKSPFSRKTRYCIPDGFSLSKNPLAHSLGMPLGFPTGREDISHDPEVIQGYIDQLGMDFRLVMIMEYFHQSLILFKRTMCWSHFDVLYKHVNAGNYTYKSELPDPELVNIHKQWSWVDYKLYDHFNRTFWRQIDGYGSDFVKEVEHYTRLQQKVAQFCDKPRSDKLHIAPSQWSSGFIVKFSYCVNFSKNLLSKIQARHDIDERDLLRKAAQRTNISKPQSLC